MNVLLNFRALVSEAARRAPQARLSLGARLITEGKPVKDLVYDSPSEIEREYRWLLTMNAAR